MALGPMAFFEKLPVKKKVLNLGQITFNSAGVYNAGSIAISGYTAISAMVSNLTTTSAKGAISPMIYNNSSLYLLGAISATVSGVETTIYYLPNDYFDIQSV